MTNEDRKRLMVFLDEYCPACSSNEWRKFTTPDDFFACFNRLVELGEWEKFYWVAWGVWLDRETEDLCGDEGFTQWLLSRTESGHYRLCVLVSEWLTAQKEGV